MLARAAGEAVRGRSGNDQLASFLDRTLLSGGSGDDRITTDLRPIVRDESRVTTVARQEGDDGDDWLTLLLGGSFTGVGSARLTALADGGDGADRIQEVATTPFTNGLTAFEMTLDGGAGGDWITARVGSEESEATSIRSSVKGGGGDARSS